jgi:DNA-binding response OmpR family regulator
MTVSFDRVLFDEAKVTNYRVLIVEDDVALLEAVSAFLSMKGFSVAQATTRKECHGAL